MSAPVAVITGAGSGIGRAVAERLAENGYRLGLLGRRLDRLEAVAQPIGGDALAIPCDVGDPDAVRAAFAAVNACFGRLDLLFNNAGISRRARSTSMRMRHGKQSSA